MILFHYTSQYHLPLIVQVGGLKLVESNVDLAKPHAAPDVVWLTTDVWPQQGWMNLPSHLQGILDKGRIRITVNVGNFHLHPWRIWATEQAEKLGIDPRKAKIERDALEAAGGDGGDWFVCEREVMWQEWVRIEDTVSGQVLWCQSQEQIDAEMMDIQYDTFAVPFGKVPYRVSESTWGRLALRLDDDRGRTGHGQVWIGAKNAKRLETFRTNTSMSDDDVINAMLDYADTHDSERRK
jgi:hypothetical protein